MCSKPFWTPLATSLLAGAIIVGSGVPLPARIAAETLNPIGGLPPNIVGQVREPAAFIETGDGRFLVFDRRAQTVSAVDAKKATIKKLISIGPSDGEILRPLTFVVGDERTFFVVDQPGSNERVQQFYDDGTPLAVFRRFPSPGEPLRLNADAMLSTGFGPMTAIGRNLLTQIPDGAALMSEITMTGQVTRRIGTLRRTGHESDAPLHRALNAGIPLVSPDGSLYFVFSTGVPMFRKYSAAGEFLYERHIEGPEVDATIQALPNAWPMRRVGALEFPLVDSTVRAAAIAPNGDLWISLGVPFTYVYDTGGNKTRTIVFRGAGAMAPNYFFFAKGGRLLVTPGCYEYNVTP